MKWCSLKVHAGRRRRFCQQKQRSQRHPVCIGCHHGRLQFLSRDVVSGAKLNDENQIDSRIDKLSDRELAVLQHPAQGLSNKDIADRLFISNKTVSTYKVNIFEKLGISNVVDLTDFARNNKLV
jgi:DNA-binding NarL/FixJ family response regulator